MGALESVDCCVERRSAQQPVQSFSSDLKLDKALDAEIAVVFATFGRDVGSPIKGRTDLSEMVSCLRRRGYHFPGKHDYLCMTIWDQYDPARTFWLSARDFRTWFRSQVIISTQNLRTLLQKSRWVETMVRRMHAEADTDGSGSLNIKELRNVVESVYTSLGEPLPPEKEIQEVATEVLLDNDDGDGELDIQEFHSVMIELLTRVYYVYFNDSMNNPECTRNMESIKASFRLDKNPLLVPPAMNNSASPTHNRSRTRVHRSGARAA